MQILKVIFLGFWESQLDVSHPQIDSEILFADQDSVRLLAVEGCAALGKLLDPADCVANVLPVIVSFSQVGNSHSIFVSAFSFDPFCLLSPTCCLVTLQLGTYSALILMF